MTLPSRDDAREAMLGITDSWIRDKVCKGNDLSVSKQILTAYANGELVEVNLSTKLNGENK